MINPQKNGELIEKRHIALAKFGNSLKKKIQEDSFLELCKKAGAENPWFTKEFISFSLDVWAQALSENSLQSWLADYSFQPSKQKTVALISAGNIPFASFHDIICVLVSGHKALIKPSSKDAHLTEWLIASLIEAYPPFEFQLELTEGFLKDFDAVIATGSSNSARYFNFYFGKYPHIIRENRVGVAVLTGQEKSTDFEGLANDIFLYYGQGCRNTSLLFLPDNYPIPDFCAQLPDIFGVNNHHLYQNCYEYQRALLLMDRKPFFDTGFLVLEENTNPVSPLAKLNIARYSNQEDLTQKLENLKSKTQVVSGINHLPFGLAQKPGLNDYADGVDTLNFLLSLQ